MNFNKEKLQGARFPIFTKGRLNLHNYDFSNRVTNNGIQKKILLFLDLNKNILKRNKPEQKVLFFNHFWKYSLPLVRLHRSCAACGETVTIDKFRII